tara:strand:+ start:642 stop:1037 length:396 start_codon:yes stop_codon:yes gene_type:complete
MTGFSNSGKVKIFMKTFGHKVHDTPTFPDEDTSKLGMLLLEEELAEFYKALAEKDIIGIADGLTDLLYVVYGIGHSFGIDLDPLFTEVHKSNMSKLDDEGKPIYRKDGKILKGPSYKPPDIEGVLRKYKNK